MIPRTLVIATVEPLLIGSGVPTDLDVDAAMQVDELGLPYLARRQLIARLRDAGQRVRAGFANETGLDERIAVLLGAAGTVGAGRILHLGDAKLPPSEYRAAKQARDEQVAEGTHAGVLAAKAEVTSNYTVEETQTAVDDDAAPKVGALRWERLAKPGLVFTAMLEWDRVPSADDVTVLARMVLALQQFGGGESRGRGRVEVTLDGDPGLTVECASRHLTGDVSPVAEDTAVLPSATVGVPHTRYVTLRLSQRADLAVNDPAEARHGAIAGAALRGAVYRAVRRDPRLSWLLVESGLVRYGAAFLLDRAYELVLLPPLDTVVVEDGRRVPAVRDVLNHQFAADERFEWERSPIVFSGDKRVMKRVSVPFQATQRLDRRPGSNPAGQPLYFETDVLSTGHFFESEIELVGTDSQVEEAHAALRILAGTTLRTGPNAEAFGGDLLVSVEEDLRDSSVLAPAYGVDVEEDGVHLAVVLATPALVRDPATGIYSAAALSSAVAAQWASAMGVDWAVSVVGKAVDVAGAGGFNQLYGGLRPEHQAASAGSVVHLRIEPRAGAPAGKLPSLPTARLGDRVADGFGQWYVRQETPYAVDTGELLREAVIEDRAMLDMEEPKPRDDAARYRPEDADPSSPNILVVGFTLTLCTDTALRDGGRHAEVPPDERDDPEVGEANRLALYRDAEGRPALRGTTMAGVVRHYLRRRLGAAPSDPDPDEVTALLGFARGDGGAAQSRVWFAAHPAKLPDDSEVGFRAHNRVAPETRTVADKALFYSEVLPSGTTFDCEWTVELPSDPVQARRLLTTLVAASEGLARSASDGIRIGARTGKGFGVVQASAWIVSGYDITTPEGFLAYFGRRLICPDSGLRGADDLKEALGTVLPDLAKDLEPSDDGHDAITLELTFAVGELLDDGVRPGTLRHGTGKAVKRVVTRPTDSEEKKSELALLLRRPVLEGGSTQVVPLDPGAGWHSALKRMAFKIAYARVDEPAETARARVTGQVEALFGALTARPGRGGPPKPSRVRVTEGPIDEGQTVLASRNRLDPLTQGTVKGALFTQEAIYGGRTKVTVTVARPSHQDLALLWLILRDYRDGMGETVGADAQIGYGRRVLTRCQLLSRRAVNDVVEEAFGQLDRAADASLDLARCKALFDAEGGVYR